MIKRSGVLSAFYQYIAQVFHDAMMVMCCIAPFLCGFVFRFGIPTTQKLLTQYFGLNELLTPYYLVFDLLLGALTPVLYSFAAAYVILGEIDDGISRYYAVTPVGKNGYLISRIGIPSVIAFVISIVVLMIFRLSNLSLFVIIGISFASTLMGIIQALLIVSLSTNKVEGMAVSKLSGLFFLGLPVPFFISGNIQYLLFFLPSFWMAKFAVEEKVIYLLTALLVIGLWLLVLHRRFIKKIR